MKQFNARPIDLAGFTLGVSRLQRPLLDVVAGCLKHMTALVFIASFVRYAGRRRGAGPFGAATTLKSGEARVGRRTWLIGGRPSVHAIPIEAGR